MANTDVPRPFLHPAHPKPRSTKIRSTYKKLKRGEGVLCLAVRQSTPSLSEAVLDDPPPLGTPLEPPMGSSIITAPPPAVLRQLLPNGVRPHGPRDGHGAGPRPLPQRLGSVVQKWDRSTRIFSKDANKRHPLSSVFFPPFLGLMFWCVCYLRGRSPALALSERFMADWIHKPFDFMGPHLVFKGSQVPWVSLAQC